MAANQSALLSDKRDGIIIAALVAAALALARASGIRGLGDSDPYAHLEYARQLVSSGFALRGHPYLPFTRLGADGIDLWWGFHLILAPFTIFDNLWGARLAGAVFSAVAAGCLAGILAHLGQRKAWLFVIAPMMWCPVYAYRAHLARPAHVTIVFLFICLMAGASAIRARWAFFASLVHACFHLSAPLSPVFASLGWACTRLICTERPEDRAGSDRGVLCAVAGMAGGLLLRPDRREYIGSAFLTAFEALGGQEGGKLPHAAFELVEPRPSEVLAEIVGPLLLLIIAFLVGRGRRSGAPQAIAALCLAAVPCVFLSFGSIRFVEYLVPLLCGAAALLWPSQPVGGRIFRVLVGVVAVASLGVGCWNLSRSWDVGNAIIDPPDTFEVMAAQVREVVPKGQVIFTDDPFVTEVLFSYLPEYKYIVAWDPAVLHTASPEDFWRWHHCVAEGKYCDTRNCESSPGDAVSINRVMMSFSSRFAITSYPRGVRSMQELMGADPEGFRLLFFSPGPVTGLFLWQPIDSNRALR
jgi:hypothetical protein